MCTSFYGVICSCKKISSFCIQYFTRGFLIVRCDETKSDRVWRQIGNTTTNPRRYCHHQCVYAVVQEMTRVLLAYSFYVKMFCALPKYSVHNVFFYGTSSLCNFSIYSTVLCLKCPIDGTVTNWLAHLAHCSEVIGTYLGSCLLVPSLHVVPVLVGFFSSWYSSSLPHYKTINIGSLEDSKLSLKCECEYEWMFVQSRMCVSCLGDRLEHNPPTKINDMLNERI